MNHTNPFKAMSQQQPQSQLSPSGSRRPLGSLSPLGQPAQPAQQSYARDTQASSDQAGPRRRSFIAAASAWLVASVPSWSWLSGDDRTLVRRGIQRVKPLCSLPPADYQHGARSPSVVVRSQPAIAIMQPENVERAIAAIRELLPTPAAYSPDRSLDDMASVSRPGLASPLPLGQMPVPQITDRQLLDELVKREEAQAAITAASMPKAKLLLLAQRELVMMHCEISDIALLVETNGLWHLSLRADQNPTSRRADQARNLELQIKRNAFQVNFRLLRSSRAVGEAISPAGLTPYSADQAGKLAIAHVSIDEFWVEREAPYYLTRRGFDPMIANHFNFIDQAEIEFYIRLDPLTGNGRGVVLPWQREP